MRKILFKSRKISSRWFQCIPCQAFEHFQYHESILTKVTSTLYKPVSPKYYPSFNNQSIGHPIVASNKLSVISRVKWAAFYDFLNICLSQNEVKIFLPFPSFCRTLKCEWISYTSNDYIFKDFIFHGICVTENCLGNFHKTLIFSTILSNRI